MATTRRGGLIDVPAAPLVAKSLVAVLLLLKVVFVALAPPIGDEAYYWLWGQRPALSYFDHPPLHAWLLWLSSSLFGWNIFSLRALTWVTLAAVVWVLWAMSRRMAPHRAADWFWIALAIYLASPIMFVMGSISFNDHLLVALCMLSAKFFLDFAEQWEGGQTSFRWLYLAALFLGLAGLTKYNAALLGMAYAAFIVMRPKFRPLLVRWQTYVAALLSLGIQIPSIYWNVTREFTSYRFHLLERWDGTNATDLAQVVAALLISAVSLSVFAVVPVLRLYRSDLPGYAEHARILAVLLLSGSTAAILLVNLLVGESAPYWNILAYFLALPLLVTRFRSIWAFLLHGIGGILLIALFIANLTLFPVRELVGWHDTTTHSNYDWDRIAEVVAKAKEKYPATFIAATRYTTAAQLGYAMQSPFVVEISERQTEFDNWFDRSAFLHQHALVLAAPFIPIDYARTEFERMTLIETIEIQRFGQILGTYQLYWAEDYCAGRCD